MTLIELLLALALLSMIVGTALSFMRVAERARQRGEVEEEASRRARLVMERISQALRSAAPYTGGSGRYQFKGAEDSVAFITIAGPGGPREMRYRVEEDSESKAKQLIEEERLVPGLDPFGEGEGEKRVLDRAVGQISFRYLEPGGGAWAEKWEPRAVPPPTTRADARPPRLPGAVEIKLALTTVKEGKEELIELPPRVVPVAAEERR